MNTDLSWSVMDHPYPGEDQSGDHYLVKKIHDGYLIAVVDALGHGPEANDVAKAAIDLLNFCYDLSIDELFLACHEQLKLTRGAALSIAKISFDLQMLSWAGVGNVEGILKSSENTSRIHTLPLRSGIVGYQLPQLSVSKIQLISGDVLMFATDGIDILCADSFPIMRSLNQITSHIMTRCWKKNDDALVLVVKYQRQEGAPECPPI